MIVYYYINDVMIASLSWRHKERYQDETMQLLTKLMLKYMYGSFVTYRTSFTPVVSYKIQLRQKDSRQRCVTL